MNTVTVHLNDEECRILVRAAEVYDGDVPSMMKQLVFERLEDEFDLKEIADYEARERNGETEYYSADQMWHMLGSDNVQNRI